MTKVALYYTLTNLNILCNECIAMKDKLNVVEIDAMRTKIAKEYKGIALKTREIAGTQSKNQMAKKMLAIVRKKMTILRIDYKRLHSTQYTNSKEVSVQDSIKEF